MNTHGRKRAFSLLLASIALTCIYSFSFEKPSSFKEGDLVEVQVGFVAVPWKSLKGGVRAKGPSSKTMKMKLVLRIVCLLDDTETDVRTLLLTEMGC